MHWWIWVIIGIVAVIVLGMVTMLIITVPIANKVFKDQFMRPDVPTAGWTRYKCSFPDNEENMDMHNQGMAWGEREKEFMSEVSINNKGFKLAGQYFDFGFDKTAFFLAGRAEPCTYSYYFAMPYKEYGYNVLVVDNRGNGLSDGTFQAAGLLESDDAKEWIKFLQREKGINNVVIHGICLGSATGLEAITMPDCPKIVKGFIGDGMYTTFYETFRTHTKERGKPTFPFCQLVAIKFKKLTGRSIISNGPIKDLPKYKGPLLMLHGKKDVFSLPPKAEKLFALSASEHKKLVWFDEGMHSHLKIVAPEKYNKVVGEFLKEIEAL